MRNLSFFLLLAACISLSGCDKKAKSTSPGPAATTRPLTATRVSRLDCNTLIPVALRERHLSGASLRNGRGSDRVLECLANREDGTKLLRVVYDCSPASDLAHFAAKKREAPELGYDGTAITGLGRDAYGSDSSLFFYDDDTDCSVNVVTYDQPTAMTLAKELSTALVPALLPYQLLCARVLPQPLRDRLEPTDSTAPGATCTFKDDSGTATVEYACGSVFQPSEIAERDARDRKHLIASEQVAGIGAAARLSSAVGAQQVQFVDPETACLVTVRGSQTIRKEHLLELARSIEQGLTEDTAR